MGIFSTAAAAAATAISGCEGGARLSGARSSPRGARAPLAGVASGGFSLSRRGREKSRKPSAAALGAAGGEGGARVGATSSENRRAAGHGTPFQLLTPQGSLSDNGGKQSGASPEPLRRGGAAGGEGDSTACCETSGGSAETLRGSGDGEDLSPKRQSPVAAVGRGAFFSQPRRAQQPPYGLATTTGDGGSDGDAAELATGGSAHGPGVAATAPRKIVGAAAATSAAAAAAFPTAAAGSSAGSASAPGKSGGGATRLRGWFTTAADVGCARAPPHDPLRAAGGGARGAVRARGALASCEVAPAAPEQTAGADGGGRAEGAPGAASSPHTDLFLQHAADLQAALGVFAATPLGRSTQPAGTLARSPSAAAAALAALAADEQQRQPALFARFWDTPAATAQGGPADHRLLGIPSQPGRPRAEDAGGAAASQDGCYAMAAAAALLGDLFAAAAAAGDGATAGDGAGARNAAAAAAGCAAGAGAACGGISAGACCAAAGAGCSSSPGCGNIGASNACRASGSSAITSCAPRAPLTQEEEAAAAAAAAAAIAPLFPWPTAPGGGWQTAAPASREASQLQLPAFPGAAAAPGAPADGDGGAVAGAAAGASVAGAFGVAASQRQSEGVVREPQGDESFGLESAFSQCCLAGGGYGVDGAGGSQLGGFGRATCGSPDGACAAHASGFAAYPGLGYVGAAGGGPGSAGAGSRAGPVLLAGGSPHLAGSAGSYSAGGGPVVPSATASPVLADDGAAAAGSGGGRGGRHFACPVVLAHPDEFVNPSSFLKVYGDPLCASSAVEGGRRPHSAQAAASALVASGKNGNWRCARCSNINYPRRFRCNKCSEVRDAAGDQIVADYVLAVYHYHMRYSRSAGSNAIGSGGSGGGGSGGAGTVAGCSGSGAGGYCTAAAAAAGCNGGSCPAAVASGHGGTAGARARFPTSAGAAAATPTWSPAWPHSAVSPGPVIRESLPAVPTSVAAEAAETGAGGDRWHHLGSVEGGPGRRPALLRASEPPAVIAERPPVGRRVATHPFANGGGDRGRQRCRSFSGTAAAAVPASRPPLPETATGRRTLSGGPPAPLLASPTPVAATRTHPFRTF